MDIKYKSGFDIFMRVAIITSDTMGPIKNGGVGTACFALAETLSQAHMEVTVCYAAWADEHLQDFTYWQKYYCSKNIRLLAVPRPAIDLEFAGPSSASYAVYQFLKVQIAHHQWDVIHFPDMHGLGYYALQAKKTMGAFSKTYLCTTLHGPGHWHKNHQSSITSLDELEHRFLEKKSVENCDFLFAPTQHILDWAKEQNYQLPSSILVEPNIVPTDTLPSPKSKTEKIDEIVFFGRLEYRKGLDLFIEAIKKTNLNKKIIFLGKNGAIHNTTGIEYIERNLGSTDISYEIISDLGSKEALAYLAQGHRLAVIPSRAESMGYTVLECMEAGIPFIASHIPPFLELIKEENHSPFFELNSDSLALKIKKALAQPPPHPERRKSNSEVKESWIRWHLELAAPKTAVTFNSYPKISVCIPHRNRPGFLESCLLSLRNQKYPGLEILIGDDASDEATSQEFLRSLNGDPSVRVHLFKEQRGPAFIRNRLAEMATGELLLFMDDDNVAKMGELETFAQAHQKTRADILTCAFDRVTETKGGYLKTQSRWVPLGNALAVGFFFNAFGDTNSLFKKEVFLKLKGFNETPNMIGEDWDLLARASMQGYSIEMIPEALLWYREHSTNYSKRTNRESSHKILLNSYMEGMNGPLLQELLWFLNGVALGLPRENSFSKWSGMVSENIYHDPFEIRSFYPKSLYTLSHMDFEEVAQPLFDLKSETREDGLILVSQGEDPQFEFASLDFTGKAVMIEATIESPTETEFTVFYQTVSEPHYSVDKSITFTLFPGDNFIQIPLKGEITGKLRIDPASTAGEFPLKQLRIFSEI